MTGRRYNVLAAAVLALFTAAAVSAAAGIIAAFIWLASR